MSKLMKSKRAGIEDFLCPFTDMYITQGSNGNFSHKGTMANDVRGREAGVRYPYYAPCTCKCLKIYRDSGQSMWQSLEKVRFANGRIDFATFMVCHDDTQNCKISQIVYQGEQIGNMGTKGNATGVHCHIEISQSSDTSWIRNKYGIYMFNNEYDTDECYFTDGVNIIEGMGGNWRNTDSIKVEEKEKVDQILHKGSKVQLQGTYIVKDINVKDNTSLIEIEGKEYWISSNPLLEVE